MKKYLLTFTALMTVSTAYALDCSVRPSCGDLGYTKSAADCEGLDTLKCPFGDAFFCLGTACKVGSLVYSNSSCYEYGKNPSGTTLLGVVVDADNRIALRPENLSASNWGRNNYDYALSNTYSSATSGFDNTKSLEDEAVAEADTALYPYHVCFNKEYVTGTQGKWFLPSVTEWQTICNNLEAINDGFASITSNIGLSTSYTMMTSNEASSTAAVYFSMGACNTNTTGKTSITAYYRCAIHY